MTTSMNANGLETKLAEGRAVLVADIQPLLRDLVNRYGGVRNAGRAYDERYGHRGAGYRLLCRLLYSETDAITEWTYDKLMTLAAS